MTAVCFAKIDTSSKFEQFPAQEQKIELLLSINMASVDLPDAVDGLCHSSYTTQISVHTEKL